MWIHGIAQRVLEDGCLPRPRSGPSRRGELLRRGAAAHGRPAQAFGDHRIVRAPRPEDLGRVRPRGRTSAQGDREVHAEAIQMSKICLDTTALSEAIREKPDALALL